MAKHYERPEDPTDTVFDPASDTFGPIMAAIQSGEFETAQQLLGGLTGVPEHRELYAIAYDTYRDNPNPHAWDLDSRRFLTYEDAEERAILDSHEDGDRPDEPCVVIALTCIAIGPCEECGVAKVDTRYKGADGRSVCDECRDADEGASHGLQCAIRFSPAACGKADRLDV